MFFYSDNKNFYYQLSLYMIKRLGFKFKLKDPNNFKGYSTIINGTYYRFFYSENSLEIYLKIDNRLLINTQVIKKLSNLLGYDKF